MRGGRSAPRPHRTRRAGDLPPLRRAVRARGGGVGGLGGRL